MLDRFILNLRLPRKLIWVEPKVGPFHTLLHPNQKAENKINSEEKYNPKSSIRSLYRNTKAGCEVRDRFSLIVCGPNVRFGTRRKAY